MSRTLRRYNDGGKWEFIEANLVDARTDILDAHLTHFETKHFVIGARVGTALFRVWCIGRFGGVVLHFYAIGRELVISSFHFAWFLHLILYSQIYRHALHHF